ncbi:MAG: transcription antitermination factor NusB [Bryobacteraceae bacterium]
MPARRKSRQRALQVLYMSDLTGMPVEEALRIFREHLYFAEREEECGDDLPLPPEIDAFLDTLSLGAGACIPELDELIARHAEHWRLERMPRVDRSILRMAVYEMRDIGTPPPVVIDEALELARRYTGEEAIPFLNGVLDAVRKTLFPEAAAQSG